MIYLALNPIAPLLDVFYLHFYYECALGTDEGVGHIKEVQISQQEQESKGRADWCIAIVSKIQVLELIDLIIPLVTNFYFISKMQKLSITCSGAAIHH